MKMEEEFVDAVNEGNFEKVKYAIDNGANIHDYADLAIHIAVHDGNTEIVRIIWKKSTRFDRWNFGRLHHVLIDSATSNGHLKIFEFFLKKGIVLHIHQNIIFRNLGMYRHQKIIKLFLKNGQDVYIKNIYDYLFVARYRMSNLLIRKTIAKKLIF